MSSLEPTNPLHVSKIATGLQLAEGQVANTIELLNDECTVPFIARYRKERTGNLDEVQIRNIRDRHEYLSQLEERKAAVLRSIQEQEKLTPELKASIEACESKTLLEDLYLPYKPKKRTRGQIAKERGLEPLAQSLLSQKLAPEQLQPAFEEATSLHEDLKSVEDVKKGVKDYIAESISEIAELRQELRNWIFQNASYKSVVKEEFKDKKTKYTDYYDFSEPVANIATHRLMALRRAEKEGVVRVTVTYDTEPPLTAAENAAILPTTTGELREFLKDCVKDGFDRILSTSTETEIRLESKNKAEEDAIRVFSKNLRNLLLLPPIPSRVVLGIDPGIRTGSKLVVVDQTGKLLEHDTIYPAFGDVSHAKSQQAISKVLGLIQKHNVTIVSVGNGTGSREISDLVQHALDSQKLSDTVKLAVVNESGASVYSASDVAREEFPDLDVTVRGSVSIARRLQDPLAEFVKIDPKSIGVGQYQHDVNQAKLKKSLSEVVESCVNYVGVNLNTASSSLLSYVAGIGPNLAKSIVRRREEMGSFKSRAELLEIQGFGPKSFEQSAGFLRIPDSENPLDSTAVHPESYEIVKKISESLSVDLKQLLGNREVLKKVDLEKFQDEKTGLLTLKDILAELQKPGRDPREDGASQRYSRSVRKISDLKEGQILEGTVTNVTNFGAFVDIGVHQDGLVHVSELSTEFVKDASTAISVGDRVKVMVIGVDTERKRISLSRKACMEGGGKPVFESQKAAGGGERGRNPSQGRGRRNTHQSASRAGASSREGSSRKGPRRSDRNGPAASSQDRAPQKRSEPQKPASMNDLLQKFNTKV